MIPSSPYLDRGRIFKSFDEILFVNSTGTSFFTFGRKNAVRFNGVWTRGQQYSLFSICAVVLQSHAIVVTSHVPSLLTCGLSCGGWAGSPNRAQYCPPTTWRGFGWGRGGGPASVYRVFVLKVLIYKIRKERDLSGNYCWKSEIREWVWQLFPVRVNTSLIIQKCINTHQWLTVTMRMHHHFLLINPPTESSLGDMTTGQLAVRSWACIPSTSIYPSEFNLSRYVLAMSPDQHEQSHMAFPWGQIWQRCAANLWIHFWGHAERMKPF